MTIYIPWNETISLFFGENFLTANPAKRFAAESEEKDRPAYVESLMSFLSPQDFF